MRYATVTGVARDDLKDVGAWLYAETMRQIHQLNPGTGVELLIPDFSGRPELLEMICEAAPEVYAHNLETVPRLFKSVRPAFRYDLALAVLTCAPPLSTTPSNAGCTHRNSSSSSTKRNRSGSWA